MLQIATPPAKPDLDDCYFYHASTLSNGADVGGPGDHWDLRGIFDQYIGDYPLKGKTVFDFGAASGFLAFSAEDAGAAAVTAFDTLTLADQQRVPFAGERWLEDRSGWVRQNDFTQAKMHNSFWHVWHEKQSKVRMIYGHANDLYDFGEKFDVVTAGAIIEHLSDPVSTIGVLANLAREALIIAFTPVVGDPGEMMKPVVPWDTPNVSFVWWMLSVDLYRRVLGNLGFDIEIKNCVARQVVGDTVQTVPRNTIVCRRR